MKDPILNEEIEQKVLTLLESILDLTRASAKDWRFESRSSTDGMATLKIKHGDLNVYFRESTFLLNTRFPDGDYVYIQNMHLTSNLKGKIHATVSEICDVLMDSPEYIKWGGGKVDERIATTIDKMTVSVEKAKEALTPKPEPEAEEEPDDIKLIDATPPKKKGLLARLCRGG